MGHAGMTGPEVVGSFALNVKTLGVYCILLTAPGSKADIIEGLQAGADDYVTKPVNADELQVRLNGAQPSLVPRGAAPSELKMQALDSAGDAILITDPDGKIESANLMLSDSSRVQKRVSLESQSRLH